MAATATLDRAAFEALLVHDPDDADVHAGLGNLLRLQGERGRALYHCRRAMELDPDHEASTTNLAAVLHDLGRPVEAAELLLALVARQPDHALAHYNLGLLFHEHNELTSALHHYRLALTLDPSNPHTRWNLANALLLAGEYPVAWPLYEARMETGATTPAPYTQPLWDGTPFADHTLLLHAEQGIGDTLQFLRLVKQAHLRGGRVVLLVPPAVVPLAAGVAGVDQVVAGEPGGNPGLPFDLHLPLPSLPGRLGLTLADLPGELPYLTPPTDRLAPWGERLGPRRPGERRVGLVWAGNPRHGNDANRSLPLAALAPLARIDGVRLFALQKGETAQTGDAAVELTDLAPHLHDFADTAAALAHLDLLITVDTAAAHLAGAVGRPVWTLLPFAPDWRWQLDRDDSPWYPTMHLFRQPQPGDWEAVVSRVAAALAASVAE